MTDCAICGATFDPAGDGEYVEIMVAWKRSHDRDDVDEYVMHEWCASAVVAGWREP